VAGYGSHGVSCGSCGSALEWQSYGGRVTFDLDLYREISESQWGTVTLSCSRYGLEEDDYDISDSQHEDTLAEDWKCPHCEARLGEDEVVFWAWDDPEGCFGAADEMLQDELGRQPEREPFEFWFDDCGESHLVQGEVMGPHRFQLSVTDKLEDKAWAQAEVSFRTVQVGPFSFDDDSSCHYDGRMQESPRDDHGQTWACELYAGHEGPCRVKPGDYPIPVSGRQMDAWEDGEWVIAVEADSAEAQAQDEAVAAAVIAEFFGDPMADLGL
jgi:hypothetical protein